MNHTPLYERQLIGGRVLASNITWNFIMLAFPLGLALITTPFLIQGLGIERFGALNLMWILVGYFSLFDMGLGRAVTKLVAEKMGREQAEDIAELVWTASFVVLVLGLLGSLIIVLATPWIVYRVLDLSEELRPEMVSAFRLLSISIPITTMTSVLRGVLEAQQRFAVAGVIRLPLLLAIYVAPLLILPIAIDLVPIVIALTLGRGITLILHLVLCVASVPRMRESIIVTRNALRPLFLFGGWVTVSNIVGPILVYLDRFAIAGIVSVTALSYYATSSEIVTKLLTISGAVVAVLFPAFATYANSPRRVAMLFERSTRYLFIVMYPLSLILVTLGGTGLEFWLGKEFAAEATLVLQILVAGVFINSFGALPKALLQAAGYPKVTAMIHLIELALYVLFLPLLTINFGIEGASVAWVMRSAFDTLVLFILSDRLILQNQERGASYKLEVLVLALLTFVLGIYMPTFWIEAIFLSFVLATFAVIVWFVILSSTDQQLLLAQMREFRLSLKRRFT